MLEEVTAPVHPDISAAPEPPAPCESRAKEKLVCPLCRGQINGWIGTCSTIYERKGQKLCFTMQSTFVEERGLDGVFVTEEGSLLTVFFLFQVLRLQVKASLMEEANLSCSFSRSREACRVIQLRGQSRIQSRTSSLLGENCNTESNTSPVEDDNNSSESTPNSRHHGDQSRQGRSDDEKL
ncbi:hypothetical protein Syun_025853 [Stephania yunnanensis]|uniref:Uncharacterized protein n=1 Tax=Stephania yunnanensis TaxID=152371 RepID=A0AAP0EXX8_9MAGN